MEKKIEVITFRTDTETKEYLNRIANEKEWSIAQVVNKICKEHFANKTQYKILMNTEMNQEIEQVLREKKWNIVDLINVFLESLTPNMVEEITSAFDMGIDEVAITLDTRLKED